MALAPNPLSQDGPHPLIPSRKMALTPNPLSQIWERGKFGDEVLCLYFA